VDIPSAHVVLPKFVLDDLQYWADDATQFMESVFGKAPAEAERVDSRDTSIIGSRYFAMSKRSDSDGASTVDGRRGSLSNETVVKISISEGESPFAMPKLYRYMYLYLC
jgi:autophagy-related protein 2